MRYGLGTPANATGLSEDAVYDFSSALKPLEPAFGVPLTDAERENRLLVKGCPKGQEAGCATEAQIVVQRSQAMDTTLVLQGKCLRI